MGAHALGRQQAHQNIETRALGQCLVLDPAALALDLAVLVLHSEGINLSVSQAPPFKLLSKLSALINLVFVGGSLAREPEWESLTGKSKLCNTLTWDAMTLRVPRINLMFVGRSLARTLSPQPPVHIYFTIHPSPCPLCAYVFKKSVRQRSQRARCMSDP